MDRILILNSIIYSHDHQFLSTVSVGILAQINAIDESDCQVISLGFRQIASRGLWIYRKATGHQDRLQGGKLCIRVAPLIHQPPVGRWRSPIVLDLNKPHFIDASISHQEEGLPAVRFDLLTTTNGVFRDKTQSNLASFPTFLPLPKHSTRFHIKKPNHTPMIALLLPKQAYILINNCNRLKIQQFPKSEVFFFDINKHILFLWRLQFSKCVLFRGRRSMSCLNEL